MMKWIPNDLNIGFMGQRYISMSASAAVTLVGVVFYFILGGFNYGVDFRGGSVVQIKFAKAHDLGEIRNVLNNADIGNFALQAFGDVQQNEILVSLPHTNVDEKSEETLSNRVRDVIAKAYPDMTVRRMESVGPRVGEELRASAWEAIVFSLLAIMIYVWFRFEWRYGVGAIVATVHDVLVVLTAFVLTRKEITLDVVAAVLTVAGYSVNDTIVIFDRIRENMRKFQKKEALEIMNSSLNQTLSRTTLTSGTVLLVLIAMYILGGDITRDFAFALLIGVVVGTYSSIYIASPVTYALMQRFPARSK